MNRQILLALVGVIAWTGWCSVAHAEEKLPPAADVVKLRVTADKPDAEGLQTVTINLTILEKWFILSNPVGDPELIMGETVVAISGTGKPEVVKIDYPPGMPYEDRAFRVYKDKVEIRAVIRRASGDKDPVEISVKFVPHNDSLCLIPATLMATIP